MLELLNVLKTKYNLYIENTKKKLINKDINLEQYKEFKEEALKEIKNAKDIYNDKIDITHLCNNCEKYYYFVKKFNEEKITDVPLKININSNNLYNYSCNIYFYIGQEKDNDNSYEKYINFKNSTIEKILELEDPSIKVPIKVEFKDNKNYKTCEELKLFINIYNMNNNNYYLKYKTTKKNWFGNQYCYYEII